MEELYHVRLERENDYSKTVIETDIRQLDLIERIAKPYETQVTSSFYCGGFSIVKSEVRSIDIFKTNIPLEAISTKRNDDAWNIIREKGEDVTLQFVKYRVNPWRDKKTNLSKWSHYYFKI